MIMSSIQFSLTTFYMRHLKVRILRNKIVIQNQYAQLTLGRLDLVVTIRHIKQVIASAQNNYGHTLTHPIFYLWHGRGKFPERCRTQI